MQRSKTIHTKRLSRRNINESYETIPEIDLDEEFSLMLTVNIENENMNPIRYNFQKRAYRPIKIIHYPIITLIEGSVDHRSTLELFNDRRASQVTSDPSMHEEVEVSERVPKAVRSRFDFCNVGTQTSNYPPRHQLIETQPPDAVLFSGNNSQWIIYDAYINVKKKRKIVEHDPPITLQPSVNRLAEITERMIIQNLYDHLFEDFKYYEDPADEVRDKFGCLLPLWKFAPEETKYVSVTSICWSPQYSDLFAVSFGSFSFTYQREGAILLFSLKNPLHPINSFRTDCGVMSIDINQKFSNHLCAGLYDGSVAAYDLSQHTGEPDKQSKRGVHRMYVSQVQWDKSLTDEQLIFYSVSVDGLIVKWSLLQNSLKHCILVTLGIIETSSTEPQTTTVLGFGSGITLDFHASNFGLYLVGTQMGHGHLCIRTHSSEALQTFDAHDLSVYKIAWNTFHPKIFITCSDDWTVKIWEHEGIIGKPSFKYDLGSQVYDVEWAPFSSTVFAAVTAKGEVFVYDLSIDKHEPLCKQVVLFWMNTKATCVTFNRLHPVILVGDDRGEITCLKLSPNLRKISKKSPDPSDKKGRKEFEISKLEDILPTVPKKCY